MSSKAVKKKKDNKLIWLCFVSAGIIPLLVQLVIQNNGLSEYDWFSSNDIEYDFFLTYKMWGIIILGLIMLSIILWRLYHSYNVYKDAFSCNRVILGCMGVYIICALVSSILAHNPSDAFWGGYSQHEPYFVLLGYAVIMLFSYMFVSEERDAVSFIELFMWGVMIISLIGVLQYAGADLFVSSFGKSLITMFSSLNADAISLSFEEGRVYMTLYNPNYVGSYVALVLPVIIAGICIVKKIWKKIVMGIIALMLLLCLIGSASTTGMTAIVLSLVLFAVLSIPMLGRYRKYIAMIFGGAALIVAAVSVINNDTIREALGKYTLTEDTRILTGMNIEGDELELTYKDTAMYVSSELTDSGNLKLVISDDEHKSIEYQYDEASGLIYTDDEFYSDIAFKAVSLNDGTPGFSVICGSTYTFTNNTGDGRYYYYNAYGKLTRDVVNSESIGFEGHESFASNRGFIWSRSLPLMLDNILYGCGPDNYIYEFPNNDYIAMANNTYNSQVVTKPHNMYFQIGIQTGLISLIAILVLYVVYFIQSVRVLWSSKGATPAYMIAMSILVGSFGYMVCGMANDSTVGVAPVFWTLIGLGLACNRMLIRR